MLVYSKDDLIPTSDVCIISWITWKAHCDVDDASPRMHQITDVESIHQTSCDWFRSLFLFSHILQKCHPSKSRPAEVDVLNT